MLLTTLTPRENLQESILVDVFRTRTLLSLKVGIMAFALLSVVLFHLAAEPIAEPLTTAQAVRELSPTAAASRRPVKLNGVVTHANPSIQDFFMQDESAGIYITPSGHGAGLTAGDHIEVEGFSNEGTFSPCVVPSAVRHLGRKPLPEPEITDLRQRERIWLDSQYVQVWLYVRDVRFTNDFQYLPAATAHGLAALVVPGPNDQSLIELKGRTIRARGVVAVAHDPKQRLANNFVRIFVQSPAELKTAPSIQPNLEPMRIVECFRRFSHVPMAAARPISIAGVVTAQIDPDTLALQDATGGAIVSLLAGVKADVGDEIVATGFLIPGRTGVRLQQATARRTGAAPVPEEVAATAYQAMQRFGQRVRVRGMFENAIIQKTNVTVNLHDGPTRFLATFVTQEPSQEVLDVPQGSEIEVTGVAAPVGEETLDTPPGLRIHLNSADDLQVLRVPAPPSWWTAERVAGLGVAFVCLLGIGGLWVWLLRRQVAKQATVITSHFQREAELADSLRQARKLEAIGRLAGGIAHDFNNLLTVIIGNSTLATDALEPDHAAREHIEAIETAGQRAAELTRQLLSFSRQQAVSLAPLDLNAVVGNAQNLLQRLIGEHIQLSVTCAPDLPLVLADSTLIHQILLNLAANARDAMPTGGELRICTSLEPTPANLTLVRLSVTDTGCGMTPATQARIFEPFFTTKDVGKGTGLGLAAVYGVVKTLHGTIQVQSAVDQGTTFHITFLPHAGVEAPTPQPPATRPRGNRAVVLLVDDDEGVRRLCTRALQLYGYDVLSCARPVAAVELVRETAKPIALLITDMVMPMMNGRELADAVRVIKPGILVLFMSGYPQEDVARVVGDLGDVQIIQKPFTPIQLATKAHEMLDETAISRKLTAAPKGSGFASLEL